MGFGFKKDLDFKNGKDFLISNAKNILEAENYSVKVTVELGRPVIKSVNKDWDLYEDIKGELTREEVKYFVPDLALPIHKKRDFICPESDIEILKKQFQLIDCVIIIGWKAADAFLLNIIKDHIGNRPIIVVSPNSAKEVQKKIIEDCNLEPSRVVILNKGFTKFIKDGDCDKILAAENMDALIQSNLFKS